MSFLVEPDFKAIANEIIIKLFKEKKPLQKCQEELVKQFDAVAVYARTKERERCAGIAFDHDKDCHDHGSCIAIDILHDEILDED